MPVLIASIRFSGFAECFCQAVRQTVVSRHMWQVSNASGACFLSHHGNHVDRFLLLRQMGRRRGSDKIFSIGSHVNFCFLSRDVHPQSLQELTGSEAFHEGVELGYCCGKDCSFYLLAFVVNQRTVCVTVWGMPLSLFCQENNMSSLGRLVLIVSVRRVRITYQTVRSSQWPKT